MRTKILVTAAVALAVGMVSNAQVLGQVLSANVVGYVNTTLPGGQYSIVAPALNPGSTGDNTVSNIFASNGAGGDVVLIFNNSTFTALNYFPAGRGHAVSGWYTVGNVLTNDYPINAGEAVFYKPALAETNTQVGTVLQGTNLVNAYQPTGGNYGMVASMIPVGGSITTNLDYPGGAGDVLQQWNVGSQNYTTYNYFPAGRGHAVSGWYNAANTLVDPQIPVAGGFFIKPAATTNWVQNLTVQ